MRSYPTALRKRVLSYVHKGHSKSEAAKIFSVSRKTIYNWLDLETAGDYAAKPPPRHRNPYKLNYAKLKAYIAKHPDRYLKEIADHFKVSDVAILKACRKLKISRKKKSAILRARSS